MEELIKEVKTGIADVKKALEEKDGLLVLKLVGGLGEAMAKALGYLREALEDDAKRDELGDVIDDMIKLPGILELIDGKVIDMMLDLIAKKFTDPTSTQRKEVTA